MKQKKKKTYKKRTKSRKNKFKPDLLELWRSEFADFLRKYFDIFLFKDQFLKYQLN